MLVASHLHEISRRYSAYVEEMREFLLHDGFPVDSPAAIQELAARLREDLQFRADVSSLERATLYRERGKIGYMDLLGILIVAAAGTRQAAGNDSQQEAMRETLRFLMAARRPLHVEMDEVQAPAVEALHKRIVEPVQPRPIQRAQSVMPPAESETREESETSFGSALAFLAETADEAPWWRTHAVWIVGFLAVMLGLGSGLMIREGGSAANGGAVASRPAAAPMPDAVGPVARRIRRFGRSKALAAKKPSPATPRFTERVSVPARGATEVVGAHDAAARLQPMETGAGRRPEPVLTATQGKVTDQNTLLAVFAHPAARAVVTSPVLTAGNVTSGSGASPVLREGIVRTGSAGIMAANVTFSPAPAYPAAAAVAGVQGQVTVRAVVGRDGDVTDARVVSGPPLLREAALDAVQQWRYRPYTQYGKPVAVATTAIVDFQMPR